MDRDPVESTSLASVGYDEATKTLEVEFRSGALYRYMNVPQAFHTALIEGRSPGRFFSYHIRDVYECESVEPSRPAGPARFG